VKDNTTFIEQSSILLLKLSRIFYELNIIINSKLKLRELSLEFQRLAFIRNSMTPYINNTDMLIKVLYQHLAFIRQYDLELAKYIEGYSSKQSGQAETVKNILLVIHDNEKLMANTNFLKDQIKNLSTSDLQKGLRSRLEILVKRVEEILAINKCLNDLNYWDYKTHADTDFYTNTIEGYFSGKVDLKDFTGLSSFNDKQLHASVKSDAAVKKLYYLSQFTHRAEEQAIFISRIVEFIKQDIKDGNWVTNDSTRKFYDNIDRYAQIFKIKFRNSSFSDILIANKTLGEQPFAWIRLLEKMKKLLEQVSSVQIPAIQNARASLNTIFINRINEIKSLMGILLNQMEKSINSAGKNERPYEVIEKGLIRVERAIRKLWKLRKKRFRELKTKIQRLSLIVIPEIDSLTESNQIIDDASNLIETGITWNKFNEHLDAIKQRMGQKPSTGKYDKVGLLLFDISKMESVSNNFIGLRRVINEKRRAIQEYPIDQIKLVIKELIMLYLELISYLKLLKTDNDLNQVSIDMNNFLRYYYG